MAMLQVQIKKNAALTNLIIKLYEISNLGPSTNDVTFVGEEGGLCICEILWQVGQRE